MTMADSATPPQGQGATSPQDLQVPAEVAQKFGELVTMIQASESMNAEERQYWVNILPVMTPDQIKSLRDILENERKQLAAIDTKYSKELDKAGQEEVIKRTAQERKERRQKRSTTEASHREQEEKTADSLLDQIQSL